MDLADLIASLRRRWWALVPGLVAAAALVVAAMVLVPQSYVDKASLLLLPPKSTLADVTNPYLGLGGLQPAADVLTRALNDGPEHQAIAPEEGTATFSVYRDSTTSGPIVVVEVADTSAAGARRTLDAVIERAPKILAALQSEVGVPGSDLVRIQTIAQLEKPETDSKDQLRAVLVAAVVGLGLAVLGAVLIDSLMVRRQDRAGQERTGEPRGTGRPTRRTALSRKDDDAASGDDIDPELDALRWLVRSERED